MKVDREQILQIVDKIPAFPESVHRVIELTSSIDTPPKEIVGVIEHDPILTMRLLRTVNSPYFGLSREVTGIKQAVVYVGMNTVKNVAITVATAGALPKTSKAGLDVKAIWMHSLRVGVIAKLTARRVGVSPNHLAGYFVAGLLHDIGKIVCAEYLSEPYAKVLKACQDDPGRMIEHERKILGTDHAEVGALVAEKWKLPADLIQALRVHHMLVDTPELVPEPSDLALGVCFGNIAAHQLVFKDGVVEPSDDQGPSPLPEIVKQWAGGEIEEVLPQLTGLVQEIEKAQNFMANGAAA